MAAFSTLDAMRTLTASVPDWNKRLDDLNGQIAARQIELAQLQEHERPPTRSLKNKGSTESLRPKDAANENPFFTPDADPAKPVEKAESPKSKEKIRPTSPSATRPAASSSSPLPLPASLKRNSSQPIPQQNQPRLPDFTKLRKRKTESLASGESQAPKYRTRSMIIVYYDSAVQTAFEDLVKFVSGSRNSMRKGKMAAKMAEMRRAAELEVEEDEDEDEEEEVGSGKPLTPFKSTALLATAKKDAAKDAPEAEDNDDEFTMPKLQFVSTRQMGPSQDQRSRAMPSIGMLRGYRRSGTPGGAPDIFDELDKGLEWCQAQCERAAHQFLRDGDCSEEIENIKRRLGEVKEKAAQEVERLEKEHGPAGTSPSSSSSRRPETKPRGLSSIKIRKEQLSSNLKELEVDDGEMEVDEGIEDDDGPPTLVYKKARDYAR
ncbi:hypothetical protein PVAG01_00770 [Phlyctema vagabunda]|uniref:Uncharacterized protein n=1 Tax=Phlyctema vagabunda TaxID=108571 RepID=A0ABR4PVA5_9HELO